MKLPSLSALMPWLREKALVPVRLVSSPWAILERYTGAWQANDVEVTRETALANHAVFACQTLIASDISKLRLKLLEVDANGIWTETTRAAFSPVLRKPNAYQTRIQFVESWITSKLQYGNAYILKQRDNRSVVVGLHVLDPCRVRVLVSDVSGEVFYALRRDDLSAVSTEEEVFFPASEIIHDRFNCFFHRLVGISPIFANGLAATGGLAMQQASTKLFQNGARPGGILTAPGNISEATVATLKAYFDDNFTGVNSGKTAVLGDGLRYEAMAVKATDAQLIEQLKWTAEVVCSTYHVPPYKIGVGAPPSFNNVQALNTEYYSQCLQVLIRSFALCLDEGLGIGRETGLMVQFDIDELLRMDSITQMQVIKEGVSAGVFSPNEGRAKFDRKPVEGGDSPYLQQQNYSLAALAKRDAQADPFATGGEPAPSAEPANDDEPTEAERAERRAATKALLRERVRERVNA